MMDGLNNIFSKHIKVNGVGEVNPIKLDKYGEFMECAHLLRFTKKHFDKTDLSQFSFFDLVLIQGMKMDLFYPFLHLLYLVTGKLFDVKSTDDDSFILIADGGIYLDKYNYEEFRDVVMRQNLLYEDKVFKNPMTKKWAEKVIETRNKNAVDMSLEDIVSVVHVFTGISYDEISNYTIYQLRSTFQRIIKMKDYDRDIQLLCAGSDKVKPEPFMEKIELYKDPYADVFVGKDKLKNINKVFNSN